LTPFFKGGNPAAASWTGERGPVSLAGPPERTPKKSHYVKLHVVRRTQARNLHPCGSAKRRPLRAPGFPRASVTFAACCRLTCRLAPFERSANSQFRLPLISTSPIADRRPRLPIVEHDRGQRCGLANTTGAHNPMPSTRMRWTCTTNRQNLAKCTTARNAMKSPKLYPNRRLVPACVLSTVQDGCARNQPEPACALRVNRTGRRRTKFCRSSFRLLKYHLLEERNHFCAPVRPNLYSCATSENERNPPISTDGAHRFKTLH